jgi:nicotinamidase-related amidase
MGKCALIVVDMVKDFTDPDGKVFYPENRVILPKIVQIINHCRKQGMLVIFAQHCYRNGKYDKCLENMRPCCIEGSGGEDLDPMLPVDLEKDYIIKKRRYSAFFGTDLDLVLRENSIEKLIIMGTKTNCCIRATVADAYYLEYLPVVISDCVATNSTAVNQVHLDDIQKYFGMVISSGELFEKIKEGLL